MLINPSNAASIMHLIPFINYAYMHASLPGSESDPFPVPIPILLPCIDTRMKRGPSTNASR